MIASSLWKARYAGRSIPSRRHSSLFFVGPKSAIIITAVFGLVGLMLRLSLMDLVAKLCPDGIEATSFALYMGAFNVSASLSNTFGGIAYAWGVKNLPSAYAAISVLVVIAALCKIACWPLLPILFPRKGRSG
jgi:hypothetical protein